MTPRRRDRRERMRLLRKALDNPEAIRRMASDRDMADLRRRWSERNAPSRSAGFPSSG